MNTDIKASLIPRDFGMSKKKKQNYNQKKKKKKRRRVPIREKLPITSFLKAYTYRFKY